MSELKIENASRQINENAQNSKRSSAKKSVRVYFVALCLVFAICCMYALFQMTNSRAIVITVNSVSVSKGQNPDGSAFDIYKIFSDEVLEAASEKLGGTPGAEELRGHLSVSDALNNEVNIKLKQSILDGENENTYFPTIYQVTYSVVTDRISSEGMGQVIGAFFRNLKSPGKDKILETVVQSYQEYYDNSYLTYDSMFEIEWESIDSLDYYNRAEALRTEAMRILRFLQDKSEEDITAGSLEMMTYSDLGNDLWKLISSDIDNHQAYIIQNNLTTSRKDLLRQFRYMEEIYREEKERRIEEYLILDEAVDMYDSSTTKVVFIPALDQDDSFYMNRTKVGLDYLVERADSARLAADEAEHNAQYYQYLQTCFADAINPKQSQISHADAIYQNIKDQIEEMNNSVRLLMAESNQKENEGIKAGKPGMSVGIIGIGMSFAKRFMILSMAAYVLISIPSAFRRRKQTDSQEV